VARLLPPFAKRMPGYGVEGSWLMEASSPIDETLAWFLQAKGARVPHPRFLRVGISAPFPPFQL